jgi:hypothetical protein
MGIRAPGAPPVTAQIPPVGQAPASVHTPKPARFPLAQPKKFRGNQGDDVRAWLREYEMYCLLAEVPQNKMAIFATTYLEGTPRNLWEREIEAYKVAGEFNMTQLPTFQAFKVVMLKYYDTFLPARTARKEYDAISQKTTVAAFLRELASVTHELRDTPFEPSQGDVILKFLNGLKSGTRKYCEDNAPEGWLTELDPLVEKALHHEVNQSASTSVTQSTSRAAINVTQARGRARAQPYRGGWQNRSRGRGRSTYIRPYLGVQHAPMAPRAPPPPRFCSVCGSPGHLVTHCPQTQGFM